MASESGGGKRGDKQFVDHPLALHPTGGRRGGCRMGRHYQTQTWPAWGQGNLRTIVEGARRFRFQDEYTPGLVGGSDASGPPPDPGVCSLCFAQ